MQRDGVTTRGIGCALLLLAMSGIGCDDDSPNIDRDVEKRLTIATGVYGQTTSQDDVGDHPVQYNRMDLSVFATDGDTALETVPSDDVGFYEIPLPPGDYSICTSFQRCADFRVQSGQCVRLDYEYGVGPGWAPATAIACP